MLVLALLACQLGTPTAAGGTPGATASGEAQIFTNPDYGISVTYPQGWTTEAPDDDNSLAWFLGPNDKVQSVLFVTASGGSNLEELASQVRDSVLTGLSNIAILSDQAVMLADGRSGWATLATGENSNGAELKLNLTSTLANGQLFSLLTFAGTQNYERYASEINALAASMHAETALLYGVPRDQALVLGGGESTNPRNYDPATTHGSGDKRAYSGLVSLDPQLNLTPELAETWTVTDGAIYTFVLRANARFHDGRAVTAQDVVYSWERAADPKTESDTVLTYLGDIVGVKEMRAGEAEHISGLKVIDDHTLQVTIDAPKPYFLLKLTYPTAFIVDRANIEADPEAWYRHPNGTGPYKLTRWDSFEVMVYEAYQDFYLGAPAIPYVIVKLNAGIGIRLYEAGEIDLTGVPLYDVGRVTDPNEALNQELLTGVSLCTSYVIFDVTQPPFDDVKVRQAFSMAFNRQQYIDVVLSSAALPAPGLYPPGLPGYTTGVEGLPFDPEQARQLLAESKYGGPEGLPPIIFTDAGIGADISSGTAALAQMWQQHLGVTITVENLESDRFSDEVNAGRHGQIFDGGWCADYADPENFADALFHSGAQQNDGNYNSPELDALLDQARVEQDVATRLRLYQQAEQLIIQDAPVLFITHGLSYELVKPYIQGYVLTPIDIPIERYMWFDQTKR
jgi:ABC-type transport system substrate-binding protein